MAISARKFCLWIRLFCHITLTLLFLQKKAEARGFHRCLCFVHFTALPRLFSTPCTVPVPVKGIWRKPICSLWERGYKDEDILVEICESVTGAKQEIGGLYFRTLPETQAACIYHKGSYGTLSESYESVLKYIEENGCEIAGAIRESYIDGIWNQEDESGWLTEIQIPVRNRAE